MGDNDLSREYWNQVAQKTPILDLDAMSKARRIEWDTIRKIWPITPNTHPQLIELGVGMGHFAINFARAGFNVLGVDVSQNSLDLLQKRANHNGVNDRINTLLSSFKAPQADKKFDGGYLISTFHCLSLNKNEQAIIFSNFISTIRSGGSVYIMEPNPLNPLFYLHHPFQFKKNWREGLMLVYSQKNRIKSLLRANKIRNVEVYQYGFLPTSLANTIPWIKELNEFLCTLPIIKRFCLFNIFVGAK